MYHFCVITQIRGLFLTLCFSSSISEKKKTKTNTMLFCGRLHTTSGGMNLDEVRSLLQKSLRRKDIDLVLKSCKELVGRGKDQLPWYCLVTYLYEDHCLSDFRVIKRMWECYREDDSKFNAVELLLKAFTCRYAACLPVIGLMEEFHPARDADFDQNILVDDDLKDLVVKKRHNINFDIVLAHLQKAWIDRNHKRLITYMKLASMVNDHEDTTLTDKGVRYLISDMACRKKDVGKIKPGLVVLSMLYRAEKATTEMRDYLFFSFKLASIPGVCIRLVMFSAVTQLIHSGDVKKVHDMTLGHIEWVNVSPLTNIPDWAVDKHTHRGRTGLSTKALFDKTCPVMLSPAQYEEFHGHRTKNDIHHFFSEGVKLVNETCPGENPYWNNTKNLYLREKKANQKTLKMTARFYTDITKNHTKFVCPDGDSPSAPPRGIVKSVKGGKRKLTLKSENDTKKQCIDITECVLLQVPTNRGKVYTRLSDDNTCVIKGPYTETKLRLALFFHEAMKLVLGDTHTLSVTRDGSFLRFPLLKGTDITEIKLDQRCFSDPISGKKVDKGSIVSRGNLGVVQCHRVDKETLMKFPATFWLHFMWRFCLNIGDSGLYNAITDKDMSFLYGIDMEEQRGTIKLHNLQGYMFSKLPRKTLAETIWQCLRENKDALDNLVTRYIPYSALERLGTDYHTPFDMKLFTSRLQLVQTEIQKL